jgi:hypothetical protein
MEQITTYPDGSRSIHRYEEMTADKRPQDSNMDGTGLYFHTQEYGYDCCPEAVVLIDARNRSCVYVCEQEFSDTSERPEDPRMDGWDLRFETLEHGGEFPDKMPQAIRVTDAEGRSCLYVPVQVNGRVDDGSPCAHRAASPRPRAEMSHDWNVDAALLRRSDLRLG